MCAWFLRKETNKSIFNKAFYGVKDEAETEVALEILNINIPLKEIKTN